MNNRPFQNDKQCINGGGFSRYEWVTEAFLGHEGLCHSWHSKVRFIFYLMESEVTQ